MTLPSTRLYARYPCIECLKEGYASGDLDLDEFEKLVEWRLDGYTPYNTCKHQ